MYTKVINPAKHGRKVYANTGSARRTTNYLEKEAKANGHELAFFGGAEAGKLSADEVVDMMDANHKGLRKEAAKFYSLVLSPSQDELAALGSGDHALQRYTRDVMNLYAKNFALRDDRQLGEKNLVWAAARHQDRQRRGLDEGEQGDYKLGLQTHVHIIVSARDAAHHTTLNPLGAAARFNRVTFYAQAEVQLEMQLGWDKSRNIRDEPLSWAEQVAQKEISIMERAAANRVRKPLTDEQVAAKDAKLDERIVRLNQKISEQLDPMQVKEIAKELNYAPQLYWRLSQLERDADRGNYVPERPAYLLTGKKVDIGELLEPGEKFFTVSDGTGWDAKLGELYDPGEDYYPTSTYDEPVETTPAYEWPSPMSTIERTIARMEAETAARSEQKRSELEQPDEPAQHGAEQQRELGQHRQPEQQSEPEQERDDEVEM
jgi:hypothetical protein